MITLTAGEVKKSGGSPMRCDALMKLRPILFFQPERKMRTSNGGKQDLDFGHSEPKFVTFEDFRHHLWIDKEGFRVVLESWRSSLT